MKPRRKGATQKIESIAARNVCFSKRRQGLFRKADDLRRRIPGVSVTAIAFSPGGKPFVSGDPSSLFPPPTNHNKNKIDAFLGLNTTTLNEAELQSHRDDLLRLKTFLLSKHMDTSHHDPPQQLQGHQVSRFTIDIQDEVAVEDLLDNCDDVPSQSEFTPVVSAGSQEANDEEFDVILRDLLHDDGANYNMDYGPSQMISHCDDVLSHSGFTLAKSTGIQEDNDEELKAMLENLLDDGSANCDMDHGLSHNGGSGFTQVQTDGIKEDYEFDMILTDFLNDDNANIDFGANW